MYNSTLFHLTFYTRIGTLVLVMFGKLVNTPKMHGGQAAVFLISFSRLTPSRAIERRLERDNCLLLPPQGNSNPCSAFSSTMHFVHPKPAHLPHPHLRQWELQRLPIIIHIIRLPGLGSFFIGLAMCVQQALLDHHLLLRSLWGNKQRKHMPQGKDMCFLIAAISITLKVHKQQ